MMFENWDIPSRPTKPPEVAPAPPPPPIMAIEGLTIEGAEPGQLEAALKRRMSRLLKAHQGQSELVAAREAAGVNHEILSATYQKASAVPFTSDGETLGSFFAQSEERYIQVLVAKGALSAAQLEENRAAEALAIASDELARTCPTLVSAQPQLAGSATLAAASHLAAKTKGIKRSAAPAAISAPTAPTTQDQTLLAALMKAKIRLVLAVGKAKGLTIKVKAVSDAICACAGCEAAVAPVRPTEEEVQRYLRQLEVHMLSRQTAHRQGNTLFGEQTALLQELASAEAELKEILAKCNQTADAPLPVSAAVQTAQLVLQAYSGAHSDLGYASRPSKDHRNHLDTFERSAPSAKEVKQIEILRKAMRDLGYSFGRLNEATAARNATQRIAEASVPRTGIGAALDLPSALDWLDNNDRLQTKATNQNISRATKLELLHESAQAFVAEAESVKTALHRLVVSLLPKRDEKPCDALRALINASSWMCKDLDEKEANFPVY